MNWTPRTPVPSPAEVEAARTPRGGYDRITTQAWGVPWPLPAFWKQKLRQAWIEQQAPALKRTPIPYQSFCRDDKQHDWVDQSPEGARAAKLWKCMRCGNFSVTKQRV